LSLDRCQDVFCLTYVDDIFIYTKTCGRKKVDFRRINQITVLDDPQPEMGTALSIQTQHLSAAEAHSRVIVLSGMLEDQPVQVLIDSGCTGNFVHTRIADKLAKWKIDKASTYELTGFNGTIMSTISKELRSVRLKIEGHQEELSLDVNNMKYDIVLGMAWLKKHDPDIRWKTSQLTFSNCNHGEPTERRSPSTKGLWIRTPGRMLARAEPAKRPQEYAEYDDLFQEKVGKDALPEHKPWDHRIPLKEGENPTFGPLYSLSAKEEEALRKYLEKNQAKGYIRPSESSAGYPILFVPKKGGELRLSQAQRDHHQERIPTPEDR
jgi:predicted aspartyl protease